MGQLYWNGTIHTMEQAGTVEAVLVENGRVCWAGALSQVEHLPNLKKIDLEGCTMIPAFLDPHSHFTAAANALLQADLSECVNFQEVEERIRDFIRDSRIPEGTWVTAQGYDQNALAENCHPTLALLDRAAPHHPLLVQHKSGHMGVVNTMGLKRLGITPQTQPPEGGAIGVKDGRLTGYLEENAFISYQKKVPMADLEKMMEAYRGAQKLYLSYGITTVQEGLLAPQMVPLYRDLLASGLLQVDLVGYAEERTAGEVEDAFPDHIRQYKDHFKLGGYKIFLDGSPQGRTAWMRRPYEGEREYRGYPTLTDRQVTEALTHASENGMQLLAHCNGDGAAEQLIRCMESLRQAGTDLTDLRPVLIHGQLLGVDQLDSVKELGLTVSFFTAHTWHWGDVHLKNFGWDRGSHITPAASALARGIPFTFHQDTPVLPPDMLETIWCAVNRRTASGASLPEGIPAYAALAAVTRTAAWQYFEEGEKGSIAPGKRADFAVLSRDPLQVRPEEIREVRVLRTIKDGRTLYEA